jgi:nitrite reductase/ring-hydroxylating ferredoxin subunit
MAFFALQHLHKLHDGYREPFKVAGLSLLLVHEGGKTYIIENRCPHMDVPLDRAVILPDQKIRCMAHGIEFDLKSGKPGGPLANTIDCLKHYPVAYDGNQVGIEFEP